MSGAGKKPAKPPKLGSSLTDAVVAALAKVDERAEKKEGEAPAPAEAGCDATSTATRSIPDAGAATATEGTSPADPPAVSTAPAMVSGAPPPAAVASVTSPGGALAPAGAAGPGLAGPALAGPALAGPALSGPPASHAHGPNGFRQGAGSFSDLLRRWAGGAAIPVAGLPGAGVGAAASATSPIAPSVVVAEPAVTPSVVVAEPALAAAEPARVSGPPETVSEDVTATIPDTAAMAAEEPVAPAKPVNVRYYGHTDVGLVREHNEDNYLVADLAANHRGGAYRETAIRGRGSIFAVCDGMGGAAAGEVASQMAVDTIYEIMSSGPEPSDRDDFARRLVHSIEEAGHRIFSAAKMDRTRRGMGTTSTLAGLIDETLFVGQVGDSRAYVLRGDQFEMITKDQSLVNQLIEAGQLTEEEAEAFEHSNIILQALGTTEEVTVDLTFLELRKGDRVMLCSDGLCGLVHSEMMKEVLQGTPSLTDAAAKLIQMANAGGGHDNITVIIADFDGEGLAEVGEAKVAYQQDPLPPDPNARDKSMPPREPSMKAGGPKPGADVKRDDYASGAASDDVQMPQGGGKTWMLVLAVVVVLALLAGGWLAMNGMGGSSTDEGDTPPTALPETVDVEDPNLAGPNEDLGDVAGTEVTVTVTTDVEDGTLFVNGQPHGPLSSGMSLELPPGAYNLEARSGETMIASRTVTLTRAAVAVDLSVPAEDTNEETVEAPPPEVEDPGTGAAGGHETSAPPTGDEHPSGRTGRNGRTGRTGGTGGATRTGPTGPLPTNPF